MKTNGCCIALLVLAGALAGCQLQTPGRTRHMGAVSYESAFAAARDVLSQYYTVTEQDPDTGKITCLPKTVQAPPERILGGSPARHLATLRLRREDGEVSAQVSVAIQRQTRAVRRQMTSVKYDEVPNVTPAQEEAATTVEQNEAWVTQAYAHDREVQILEDLYKALHPADSKK